MKGSLCSPSIYSCPGYNANAQDPPIFRTAHNHTFRSRAKFTGNWHKTTSTRVESCRTAIKIFSPDAQSVSNSNYLCKKRQVFTRSTAAKAQSGNCKDVAIHVQMVRRWENTKYLDTSIAAVHEYYWPRKLVNFTVLNAWLPQDLPACRKRKT